MKYFKTHNKFENIWWRFQVMKKTFSSGSDINKSKKRNGSEQKMRSMLTQRSFSHFIQTIQSSRNLSSWSKPWALNTCRFSNSTINKLNVWWPKSFAFLSQRKKRCPLSPCLQEKMLNIQACAFTWNRVSSTSWKAFTASSSWKPCLSSKTCVPLHLQWGLKHGSNLSKHLQTTCQHINL
jgi:hypothetical protein